ncbi:MAG: hypothetical protein ACK58M_05290 [Acidobacteriota bacterium]|jgi:hypothetical protein|nr:hypothetical protein [Bryobacteraceae bacterium CoA2 C42]MCA2962974.1 hypothetical protein [Acidobacteriaceae bacterium]
MIFRGLLAAGLFWVSSALGADAGLLNLVMPEAKVIAGMDVARAKSSPFGQLFMKNMNLRDEDLARFLALTGFDPARDVTEVVIASVDTNTSAGANSLLLVRGNFDGGRLRAALVRNGLSVLQVVTGVEMLAKKGEKSAVAFVDASLAVAGDAAAVKAALERRAGGMGLPAATYAKAQDMSRENDVWMVTSLPVSQLAEKMPENAPGQLNGMMKGDMFRSVEQASMGVKFAATMLHLTMEAAVRSDKDATAMADVARFLAGMVQLNRDKPEVAGLASAFDSMKLTTQARNVRLTMSMPQAEIEKLVKRAQPAPVKI